MGARKRTKKDPVDVNQPPLVKLPSLEIRPRHHSLGRIHHVLQSAQEVSFRAIKEIRVSPRRSEKLLMLANGQSVIVTSRKSLARPKNVDGVLSDVGNGDLKWLSHRRLEELEAAIDGNRCETAKKEIVDSWKNALRFQAETRDAKGTAIVPGLRPPQIGALHAIGAHWSLWRDPATVVMPTGTGKTETMLAALVGYVRGTLLVVVPSRPLREQTAKKFLTLGLLRSLELLDANVRNPIVGVLMKRPTKKSDFDFFDKCNVVVATMSAIGQGVAAGFGEVTADYVDTLIIDEAHHIAADTWSAYRDYFVERRVLQFTATPFRRDGKLVDGNVIYTYPLRMAQQDGYFQKLAFKPVYEIDLEESDRAVAEAGVGQVKSDVDEGLNHLMLARCSSIDRAEKVHSIYAQLAPELQPVLVHSKSVDAAESLAKLQSGASRIVVCVDMLGEGFDLPELKVAAVHDTHKSLAVLRQFTGRFTRTAGVAIGQATVIANIADQNVSTALERLYSEDADWNLLLSEYSSQAVQEHAELVDFLNSSMRLDGADEDGVTEISHHLLRPKFSTVVYKAPIFRPKKFFEGLPRDTQVARVWLHNKSQTLYFVTLRQPPVRWSRSRELEDRQWDLFVIHHSPEQQLLYMHSSDKSSLYEEIAKAVGATEVIRGDAVFRSLGNINRLIFQNVGVRKYGRRNLGYALYTGADVAEALSVTEKAGSVKANLFGSGWEHGSPATIGCSIKGRIWSREQGAVPEFVKWCEPVGAKLLDGAIDTTKIIENVLIPEEVVELPDTVLLGIDWPIEFLRQSEERIVLSDGVEEIPISMCEIVVEDVDRKTNTVLFRVFSETLWSVLELHLGEPRGYEVKHVTGTRLLIRVGRLESQLEQYFSDYPPLVRFVDLSELDGNLLVRPKDVRELVLPQERFETWDWTGTDATTESIWKGDQQREDSIQARAAKHYEDGGFDLVFDDDAPGEAADLVCLWEDTDNIQLALVHCKFTKGTTPGERVQDVVEVSSQAVRSAKWTWRFRELCRHVASREKRLSKESRPSRFLVGQAPDLNRYVRASRFKPVRAQIVIVQPGLSRSRCTAEQTAVLAAAHSFLKETVDVDLDVICSE